MEIKSGETLIVKNNDLVDRSVVFNADKTYPVPAESTKNFTDVFDRGLGIYGYGCDISTGAVGLFFVTPSN